MSHASYEAGRLPTQSFELTQTQHHMDAFVIAAFTYPPNQNLDNQNGWFDTLSEGLGVAFTQTPFFTAPASGVDRALEAARPVVSARIDYMDKVALLSGLGNAIDNARPFAYRPGSIEVKSWLSRLRDEHEQPDGNPNIVRAIGYLLRDIPTPPPTERVRKVLHSVWVNVTG